MKDIEICPDCNTIMEECTGEFEDFETWTCPECKEEKMVMVVK